MHADNYFLKNIHTSRYALVQGLPGRHVTLDPLEQGEDGVRGGQPPAGGGGGEVVADNPEGVGQPLEVGNKIFIPESSKKY